MRWASIAPTCRSSPRDHQDEERIANQIDASPGSEIEDSPAASRLGELSGYILAAIAIGLPGTGAVVAAGPLAAELGEVAGHVAGQVAGDLKATLMKAGMSETDAERGARRSRAAALSFSACTRAADAPPRSRRCWRRTASAGSCIRSGTTENVTKTNNEKRKAITKKD